MTVFNTLYAASYNLLYADKDYTGEAVFIDKILRRHCPQAKTLLDLGSGTGRHALELMKLGYDVTGVEMSSEMLTMAGQALCQAVPKDGQSLPKVQKGDIRDVRLGRQFDVVTSLFHVVGYQRTNEDLMAALATAYEHLPSGGVFLFDFWYGPAVLSEKPEVRIKRLDDGVTSLVRIAEPVTRYNDNIVEVHYDLFVRNKADGVQEEFKEKHEMRYLFIPEIHFLAQAGGWAVLESGEWMTAAIPSEKTWGVYTVLKKIPTPA